MSSQIIRMGIKLKDGSCVSISVWGSGMGKMEGRGSFSKVLNKCVEYSTEMERVGKVGHRNTRGEDRMINMNK